MGKPKAPKPPPLPPPVATPETTEEPADETVRRAQRRSGYGKTVLTGSLTPTSGKKTVLG